MADLPTGPTYGKIVYRALIARGDGADAGTLPDAVPASGTVTFTPSVDSFVIAGSTPPVTVFPETVTCTFNSSGDLLDPQNSVGVWLIATDSPSTNPTGFTYRVKVAIDGIAKPKQFDITVLGGTTRDLSVIGPVGVSNGVLITKGDKGDKGDTGLTGPPGPPGTGGSGDVASVNGHTGTVVLTIDDIDTLQDLLDDKLTDVSLANVPAGYTHSVKWNGTAWPSTRPTTRTDVIVIAWGGSTQPSWLIAGDNWAKDVT